MSHADVIHGFIARVRARWLLVRALETLTFAGLTVAAVLGVMIVAGRLATQSPAALGLLAPVGALACSLVGIAALVHARRRLSDRQIARFVEERIPALDDGLASAVDLIDPARADPHPSPFVETVLAENASRTESVALADLFPPHIVRRRTLQAVSALALASLVAIGAFGTVRRSIDTMSAALFPSRIHIEVAPGDVRLKAGTPLLVEARVVGGRAAVVPSLEMAERGGWRPTEMRREAAERFTHHLEAVRESFQYRVVAGRTVSPTYTATVAQAPRIARIDVDYVYPAALGLKPRTERDGGDVFAPAGTDVRLHIATDRPAVSGQLSLADGSAVPLVAGNTLELSVSMRVVSDSSYRVSLTGADGLQNPGDTEYFVRILQDRPPVVRITRPAADRPVTALEEVDIAAHADDDYGVERMELVYSVRGGPEKAVPLAIQKGSPSVDSRVTLYLEDLGVRAGDFVAYYVRARDLTRGNHANEAKSDIFFLEVKPYEQEFVLTNGQPGSGTSVDELVAAQKEVVVSTWKLDRRAQMAGGTQSDQDIRAVAGAEAELRTRVQETSSAFREGTMRNPRQRTPDGRGRPDATRAGGTLPEEDHMTAAWTAMGHAVSTLEALKPKDALAPEMDALTHLLKAQSDVRQRQISSQQAGNGGNNNRNYDMSTLFDKELQRAQQTNYENRTTASTDHASAPSMLDRIRDLARRQDELLKRQGDLARQRDNMTAEERRRELDKLTREQNELRQRAEELNQQNQSAGRESADAARRMNEASEGMRNAASDLRRQDPAAASADGARALDSLRQLERQLQQSTPGDRRRTLGDLQLEARQLAGDQRQLASRLRQMGAGEEGREAARRIAGDQERLAERLQKLQEGLKQTPGASADAGRDVERQRLADRMRRSAEDIRTGPGRSERAGAAPAASQAQRDMADMARSLDKIADALGSENGTADADSRKLSDQLSRAGDLRDTLNNTASELQKMGTGRGSAEDVQKLREAYERELQQTRQFIDQLRRDNPGLDAGPGATPRGPGMVMSAPGTEAFKQDFARWEQLRVQATQALERAEDALVKALQARQAQDRLTSGADEKAPSAYQRQIDAYFKALAEKKK